MKPGPIQLATEPVDTLVTLGGWLARHPEDVVGRLVPRGAMARYVCRTARTTIRLGGRTITRFALFNNPDPPPGEELPTDATRLAHRSCHLRAVWMEIVERDSLRALALADSLAGRLDAELGRSSPGLRFSGAGSMLWEGGRSWTGDGRTVVLAVSPPDPAYAGVEDSAGLASMPPGARDRRVLIVSFAPHSGFDPLEPRGELTQFDHEQDDERALALARADSAIGWAALPWLEPDLRSVVARLRSRPEGDSVRTPAVDSTLVRIAIAIRDSAPTLAPARRAATFLAADILLDGAARALDLADSVGADARLRRSLEATGIQYEASPLGGAWIMTRPWLWRALELDSLGDVGRAAFLTLLADGWTTRPACADGAELFERVIARGEADLRRGSRDPLVHYYLALAHADIDALAAGARDGYADPAEFASRAPEARRKAVEQFRAALAGLRQPRLRRHAWRVAMTLLLSPPERDVRYYCVYD